MKKIFKKWNKKIIYSQEIINLIIPLYRFLFLFNNKQQIIDFFKRNNILPENQAEILYDAILNGN